MSLALFKLESFSGAAGAQRVEVSFTQDDVDQAFIDGFDRARSEAQHDQSRQLQQALTQLAETLSDDEARRDRLRSEAVQALAPILHQILDLMATPQASVRLQQALLQELTRLARQAVPVRARIACGAGLHDMVQRCVAQAGLDGIDVAPLPEARITVTLDGGRIDFDTAAIGRDIRALITEITEGDPTWTH